MTVRSVPHQACTSEDAASAAELLQSGVAASQADDAARAVALFRQACAGNPNDPAAHFLLGSELATLGRMDEAETAMATTVLLAPAFHIARYQLGLLQFSSGRVAVALLTWQPLLALPDSDALLHFVRGFAALAQGDAGAARARFHAGLATRPDNAALVSDIQQVLDRLDGAAATSAPASPLTASTPVPTSASAPDIEASQILIANYGKLGTLH